MRCKPIQLVFTVALALWVLSPHAWASNAGGGLPMEAPIQKLQQSLCGPIAFGISLCAAMAAFGAIIFAGHMFGDFVRTCLYVALCISILAAVPGFASALGINGATIAADSPTDEWLYPLLKLGPAATAMLLIGGLGYQWIRMSNLPPSAPRRRSDDDERVSRN